MFFRFIRLNSRLSILEEVKFLHNTRSFIYIEITSIFCQSTHESFSYNLKISKGNPQKGYRTGQQSNHDFCLLRSFFLHSRTSHSEVFCEKSVLQIFAIFTGKHLCWSLFLIKLQAYTYFEELLWTSASVHMKRQVINNSV